MPAQALNLQKQPAGRAPIAQPVRGAEEALADRLAGPKALIETFQQSTEIVEEKESAYSAINAQNYMTKAELLFRRDLKKARNQQEVDEAKENYLTSIDNWGKEKDESGRPNLRTKKSNAAYYDQVLPQARLSADSMATERSDLINQVAYTSARTKAANQAAAMAEIGDLATANAKVEQAAAISVNAGIMTDAQAAVYLETSKANNNRRYLDGQLSRSTELPYEQAMVNLDTLSKAIPERFKDDPDGKLLAEKQLKATTKQVEDKYQFELGKSRSDINSRAVEAEQAGQPEEAIKILEPLVVDERQPEIARQIAQYNIDRLANNIYVTGIGNWLNEKQQLAASSESAGKTDQAIDIYNEIAARTDVPQHARDIAINNIERIQGNIDAQFEYDKKKADAYLIEYFTAEGVQNEALKNAEREQQKAHVEALKNLEIERVYKSIVQWTTQGYPDEQKEAIQKSIVMSHIPPKDQLSLLEVLKSPTAVDTINHVYDALRTSDTGGPVVFDDGKDVTEKVFAMALILSDDQEERQAIIESHNNDKGIMKKWIDDINKVKRNEEIEDKETAIANIDIKYISLFGLRRIEKSLFGIDQFWPDQKIPLNINNKYSYEDAAEAYKKLHLQQAEKKAREEAKRKKYENRPPAKPFDIMDWLPGPEQVLQGIFG